MKVELSRDILDGLEGGGRVYSVYDRRQPHLLVRVLPSGRRCWYWQRKVEGRVMQRKLGEWPEMGLVLARSLARERDADASAPAMRTAARAGVYTLGDLLDNLVASSRRRGLRSWRQYAANARDLAPWAGNRISRIARRDVRRWHVEWASERGQVKANRLLATVRRAYSLFIEQEDAEKMVNPASGVRAFPEEPRTRYLRVDEVRRLLESLDVCVDRWRSMGRTERRTAPTVSETMHDYLLVLLYTGQRRGNVGAMRWDEVNLDAGVWVIPAEKHKNRHAQQVPLVPQALDVLRARAESADTEWVFPARNGRKHGHVTAPSRAWAAVLAEAGLEDVRLHDLRHTMASWQVAGGANMQVIGRSLGHRSLRSTERYAHADLDPVRESMERAAAAMAATVQPNKED